MEPLRISLRIKREQRVFFVECSLIDSVEQIKRRLIPYYKHEVQDMRLYLGDRV